MAPLKGHWAGSIVATCVTQYSRLWFLSSQSSEGIWGQCFLKDRRQGIHGQLSHHTEVLPPQTKSQHVQSGPCGVHLPAQETLIHTYSHQRPLEVTFRGVDPRLPEPWQGGSAQRSVETAAQYTVPLCQEQLQDVNPIWHRVQTMVTSYVPMSEQVFSKH